MVLKNLRRYIKNIKENRPVVYQTLGKECMGQLANPSLHGGTQYSYALLRVKRRRNRPKTPPWLSRASRSACLPWYCLTRGTCQFSTDAEIKQNVDEQPPDSPSSDDLMTSSLARPQTSEVGSGERSFLCCVASNRPA